LSDWLELIEFKETSNLVKYPKGFSFVYNKRGEVKQKYTNNDSDDFTEISFMVSLLTENTLKDFITFQILKSQIEKKTLDTFITKFISKYAWNSNSVKVSDFFKE